MVLHASHLSFPLTFLDFSVFWEKSYSCSFFLNQVLWFLVTLELLSGPFTSFLLLFTRQLAQNRYFSISQYNVSPERPHPFHFVLFSAFSLFSCFQMIKKVVESRRKANPSRHYSGRTSSPIHSTTLSRTHTISDAAQTGNREKVCSIANEYLFDPLLFTGYFIDFRSSQLIPSWAMTILNFSGHEPSVWMSNKSKSTNQPDSIADKKAKGMFKSSHVTLVLHGMLRYRSFHHLWTVASQSLFWLDFLITVSSERA